MCRNLLSIALLLASGPALAWGDCEFTAKRELTLDAKGLERLAVIAAAGDLDIRGEAGLTQAIATGTACASSQALLDGILLIQGGQGNGPEGDGSTIRVVTPEASWSWGNTYAYLDLELRVPTTLALDLQDSSGDVEVENVAALSVRDSSGDLEIRGVRGAVRVDDSSGDVDVSDSGSVLVGDDSSGDLEFSNIAGDVRIESDSSGDIDLADIRGNATVEVDSSGDIVFERVQGTASVDNDSSGSIRAEVVGGDFIVRHDGSGGVSHSGVAGRVDVPEDD